MRPTQRGYLCIYQSWSPRVFHNTSPLSRVIKSNDRASIFSTVWMATAQRSGIQFRSVTSFAASLAWSLIQ